MLSRQRLRRRYPAPEPTPPGFVWAHHKEHGTQLVPITFMEAVSAKRMGKYDLYPREIRDNFKVHNRRG